MPSKGNGREKQDRNFEIVVNHINIDEAHMPQITRQSVTTLKQALGHNIKKYSGTLHYKPRNDHVHFLVMSEVPKTKRVVKASIAAPLALIFGTDSGSVEVSVFSELKAGTGPGHGLKGLGDYRSLYVNNNDHENHCPQDPEHKTVEFISAGEWEVSHGGTRRSAGRRGPLQIPVEALKVGTPEYQCKAYEEYLALLDAAAESMGCTRSTLPRVTGSFGNVPKREDGRPIRNPAYDEREFKALPKEQQTRERESTMKYLQGPDGRSLKEERVVDHKFLEGHPPDFYRFRLLEPIRKLQSGPKMLSAANLKQYHTEAFIAFLGQPPPHGWLADRTPSHATPTYNLPPAVMANRMRAR